MELASVSTNVITKSNISTSTNLLTMSTSWIQLEAHLAWHTASYVWEVIVKANGSTTAYSLDGIPTVTFNNPPDCLQPNTVYYLKSTTSSFVSPKIYSFHTTVANADADIKIDFVAGEMGTGTSFNLIFIRKNYTGGLPNSGSQKLNRFIAEPLGEMACCYPDTFSNMTEASFYFAPTGETVVCKRTSFTEGASGYYSPPFGGSYQGTSGIYGFTAGPGGIVVRWAEFFGTYWETVYHSIPANTTGTYTSSFVSPAPHAEFGSGTITFQTPMTIPDVRLYMPDAYLFVATGHHISVGTIETTLTYDTGTGCYVSEVLNHYNIPGRIYFSAPIVPRDFGNAGDWVSALKLNSVRAYQTSLNDYAYASLDEMAQDFYWAGYSGDFGLTPGSTERKILAEGGYGLATYPIPQPRIYMTEPKKIVNDYYGTPHDVYKMLVVGADYTVDWDTTDQIAALPNGTPLVFVYGAMAISYSYYQRAIKSRFTAFTTGDSGPFTYPPFKGLFKDDLRTSTFWQGADRFVIRSDSNDCYMTSLPVLP
jgi:hypothetical protein